MRHIVRLAVRTAIAAAIAIGLSSCDSGTLWEDEKYAVYWIDSADNIQLGIKLNDSTFLGRGRPISVGSDKTYLVVRNERGYFYVVKAEDDWRSDVRKGQHGPYTLEEFDPIKRRLGLPEFEKTF